MALISVLQESLYQSKLPWDAESKEVKGFFCACQLCQYGYSDLRCQVLHFLILFSDQYFFTAKVILSASKMVKRVQAFFCVVYWLRRWDRSPNGCVAVEGKARCRKQLRIVFYHQASVHLLDCCWEVENNNDKMVGPIFLCLMNMRQYNICHTLTILLCKCCCLTNRCVSTLLSPIRQSFFTKSIQNQGSSK